MNKHNKLALHNQQRRALLQLSTAALAAPWLTPASALGLDSFTNQDATSAIRAALQNGASAAVQILGKQDGFLGNDQVRIPLPGYLQDAAQLLRTFGQGAKVDELITAMNRGAEAAVPLAKDLLTNAVKNMSVADAKGILNGGNTAVTEFFATKTRAPLAVKFLPIVNTATAKVGLAEKYNQIAGKAQELGLVKKDEANIQQYVTGKALDGLYFMIAEEEKKIRANPVGYGSAVLSKVFGSLK